MLHEKEICFTLKGIYLRRAFLNDVSPLWYQVRIYYEISILAPPRPWLQEAGLVFFVLPWPPLQR